MNPLVLRDRDGPISILTLNRPERHNSLVPALLEEFLPALEATRSEAGVRAVVLRAMGPSFSTGGDIRAFYENLEDIESYSHRLVGLLNRVILTMLSLPAPIVAAVQGMVTGGSLGFVLASDVVLVAPQASFAPYYNQVGFSPDGGWTAILPAVIGVKRVAAILAQNWTISAEQSLAWGLADRLVLPESLGEEALKTAHAIGSHSPGSNASARRLLFGAYDALERRLDAEREAFIRQVTTEEARRGMEAFLASTSSNKLEV